MMIPKQNHRKAAVRVLDGVLFASLTAMDQISKYFAQKYLPGHPVDLIPGVFRLQYLENHGAAFGILGGRQWIFVMAAAVFLTASAVFYGRIPAGRRARPTRILTVTLASGALGNLIDRIRFHYVRDFLYFAAIHFPIFNVADICVTVSVFLIVIRLLFFSRESGSGLW